MQLTCPQCGSAVPAAAINIKAATATCPQCGEFSIADRVFAVKPEFVRPCHGFAVRQEWNELVITRRWLSVNTVQSLLCTVLIDATMILMWIFQRQYLNETHIVWPVGVIGASSLGYILAQFVNSSEIRINEKRISVRHYPLVWQGKMSVPWEAVDRLLIADVRSENARFGDTNTYNLNILLKNGKPITLIEHVHRKDEIAFIEKQVKKYLKIGIGLPEH